MNSTNTSDITGGHWSDAAVVWATVDSILSTLLLFTKTLILIGEIWSKMDIVHKGCTAFYTSYGLLYAGARLISDIVITSFHTENTTVIPLPWCAGVIGLQLALFLDYYLSTVVAFLILSIQLVRPLYVSRRPVWWANGAVCLVSVLFTVTPIPRIILNSKRSTVAWHDCTWNIYPTWAVRLYLYGLITPAGVVGLACAVGSLVLARQQALRIANQARAVTVTEYGHPPKAKAPKRSLMAWIIRLYLLFWLLLPVVLYIERWMSTGFIYGSVIAWSLLSLLTLLSDACVFFNGYIVDGLRRCLNKTKQRCI